MPESTNIQVRDFINQIMMTDNEKYLILEELRSTLFRTIPDVQERMMYGGIIFSLINDFGGVFVYKNHVSFEFGYGFKLSDPDKLLEGKGKFRRHLKFINDDPGGLENLSFFVQQLKTLEK